MLKHDGYYRQLDGLVMGSPSAPPLANGWLNSHDAKIKDDAKLFSRYMDDIIRSISKSNIETKLREINSLHPSPAFTIETERGTITILGHEDHLEQLSPVIDMVL